MHSKQLRSSNCAHMTITCTYVRAFASQGNDRTCVLGSLVQLEDGMLALEDPHAVVKVDTSRALTFGGFFAEGMVVLPLLTGYHQNHFLTGRDS
mmetsp:Transcript_31143/g.93361  ORF Transcript_31143/g.93361 Transcript_31143/m.93361 type:complete len:94 (-) Transcript_31143:1442-1723(-)